MTLILSTWVKFFFLFAPFFVVSMFLSLTKGATSQQRGKTANRAVMAAFLTSLILFFFGTPLFEVLGITLDSFRIGAGILLFLSAISLVREGVRVNAEVPDDQRDDISVVPLAIPTIIGPATIGTILVYGAELEGTAVLEGLAGMVLALVCLLILLHLASRLERLLGNTGLNILSKVTGLILAAMASEIVLSGLQGFISRSGL
ncbi:MarC family protein [Marinobacterium jannaschii]|uniref:MarC family protein n=1 Tax=Marinobacterium jannaschii TaxID=64970 RepID=UPI00047F68F8|nr:MarC family protein [Marinobacterium jannaschii]